MIARASSWQSWHHLQHPLCWVSDWYVSKISPCIILYSERFIHMLDKGCKPCWSSVGQIIISLPYASAFLSNLHSTCPTVFLVGWYFVFHLSNLVHGLRRHGLWYYSTHREPTGKKRKLVCAPLARQQFGMCDSICECCSPIRKS